MTSERLTPRPDWKMPDPPSPECIPYAYLVGGADGWDLFWSTSLLASGGEHWGAMGQPDKGDGTIPWPFDDEAFAKREDFAALGFLKAEDADPNEPAFWFRSVVSSNVDAVAYDCHHKLLRIRFRGGRVYQYADVPQGKHAALMRADSVGSHFARQIKGVYPFERLADA